MTTIHKETKREECERHAHECINLATHSTNPKSRAAFLTMAQTWLKLAEEAAPSPPRR
jgi:hypothetical protein